MLQNSKEQPKLKLFGFLVGIEIQDGITTAERVADALADACSWVEGVGKVDVECLGQIEIINDDIVEIVGDMKES